MTVIRVARQSFGVQHEPAAGCARIGSHDGGFDPELVPRIRLALADTFDLRGVERIELPAALALLLGADLIGTRERPFENCFEVRLAGDPAADITDDAAEPCAQQPQLPIEPVELRLGADRIVAAGARACVLGD